MMKIGTVKKENNNKKNSIHLLASFKKVSTGWEKKGKD